LYLPSVPSSFVKQLCSIYVGLLCTVAFKCSLSNKPRAAHVHVNKRNLMQWYYQYIHEQILSQQFFFNNYIIIVITCHYLLSPLLVFSFVVCNLCTFVRYCAVTVTGLQLLWQHINNKEPNSNIIIVFDVILMWRN